MVATPTLTPRRRPLAWCLVLPFCFCLSLAAKSQDSSFVTPGLVATPFDTFVREVEQQTPYRFFYRPAELDSFAVTAAAGRWRVPMLLDEVFRRSPFHFYVDVGGNVYVVKQVLINGALPDDFFDRQKPSSAAGSPGVAIPESPVAAPKLKSVVENRLFEIGAPGNTAKSRVTLAGYVTDVRNGEPLAGVSITVDSLAGGVFTDRFGYYTLTLPTGRHRLYINSVGMKATSRQVLLRDEGRLNIELTEYVPSLKEVVVTANRLSNVRSLSMGKDRLSIQTIKQIPVVFGEADVLRAALTLPGVTSVGEANTGLNVRGGAADQNLILLNDATVYNPSHLFGFFSAFNPDIVKGVELYKSAIPEKYGGRLSSVLDVTTKQGNTKKIAGAAGIGPLTSKLTVEGPLGKGTTFIASARSSYSDWLLNQVPNSAYRNSQASFADGDLHLSQTLNNKNSLFLNGYLSHDGFRLNGDTSYRYGNRNLNLKWKHLFNNQFNGLLTVGVDRYQYQLASVTNPVNAYRLSFGIQQLYLRSDFTYAPNLKHEVTFGFSSILYKLRSGSLAAVGSGSLVQAQTLAPEQGLETAVYLGDAFNLSTRLSVHAGLRFSLFHYLGPHEVYGYRPGVPKDPFTLVDTTRYGRGQVINTYSRPEIRLSVRYSLSDEASVKFSYNTLTQYVHTLSNTNSISPTDVLKLSDPHLLPQEGSQVSAGIYRNFRSNTIETSVEFYYKRMRQVLDYKSGASLLLNPHLETEVLATRGKAYGAEVLVRKTSGKLTGWIGYTFSRVLLQTADAAGGEQINGGRWYPANYDKPHNTNLTGIYKFSHRYSLSLGLSYSTGRPITLPLAVFALGGAQRVYYSERNQFRTPDYFRADVSFVLEGNHKLTKATHNDWTFGLYNLTGRKNVYSVYFIEENGKVRGYKLSIFGTPIPFVTYTIRF